MTDPILVPRTTPTGVYVTWGFAAVLAIAIGIFLPPGERGGAYAIGAGACLLAGFAANLWRGRAEGFIVRTAAATAGGIAIMGIISLVFALASITAV